MTTILNGLLGGLLVGLVAAVIARFVSKEPSATAALLVRALGSETSSVRRMEFVVWGLYGALAGGLLVALELHVLEILGVPPAPVEAISIAVAWSALLLSVLSVIWWIASSHSSGRSHLGGLLVYHLVYGLGLGLWIRLTWIT